MADYIGTSGNDTFQGTSGADSFTGGLGDDIYYVNHIRDQVIEKLNEGTDTVIASVNYTLAANVENLILDDKAAAINGTGNALNNLLIGNTASNTLNGSGGNDTVRYAQVTNQSGVTVSLAVTGAQNTIGAGTDTLSSIENLIGSAYNDSLTGNAGANALVGVEGNDTLNGGAGHDTFEGGAGDDALNGDEGLDRASYSGAASSVTVSLANPGVAQNTGGAGTDTLSSIENLTGSAYSDELTGDGGENVLFGLTGGDTLDGGGEADTLIGGAGNDTYVTDGLDTITEAADSGIDRVRASASHELEANVENLILTGSGAINGTGNELANTLTGNTAANILSGGAGQDRLIGGEGADTFVFRSLSDAGLGSTRELIVDFEPSNLSDSSPSYDLIDLAGIDANTMSEGNQEFSFLGETTFTGRAGELRSYNVSGTTNTRVEGDVDGNGLADFQITLKGVFTLDGGDFLP